MNRIQITFTDGLHITIDNITRVFVDSSSLIVHYEMIISHKTEIQSYKLDEVMEFTVL